MSANVPPVATRVCPRCRGTGRHRVSHEERVRLLAKARVPSSCSLCQGDRVVEKSSPGTPLSGMVRCRFIYQKGLIVEAFLPQSSLPDFAAHIQYGSKTAGTGFFRFSVVDNGTLIYREIVELRRITSTL